jgi:hypothetical protein
MGNAACQKADRGHLGGLDKLRLDLFEFTVGVF